MSSRSFIDELTGKMQQTTTKEDPPKRTTYDQLATTAKSFVLATSPKTAGGNEPDHDRFLSFCAKGFTHSWGHKHFVSTAPGVQGIIDGNGFLERMGKLSGKMKTWTITPNETLVDVEKKMVVVRADFTIIMPGHEHEAVVNDIVWYVTMDESGEKVVDSKEFIDPMAGKAIAEQMQSVVAAST
ncbi:hypothetical protein LTR86_005421 [Recurvomyces mirabilis]|nr:hypothetical protein LTR86_005421 [Recurvomyces mirabilis]